MVASSGSRAFEVQESPLGGGWRPGDSLSVWTIHDRLSEVRALGNCMLPSSVQLGSGKKE